MVKIGKGGKKINIVEFEEILSQYTLNPSDELYKKIEKEIKNLTANELQQIKNKHYKLLQVPKDKYKYKNKEGFKTTFSSLNKEERLEQLLKNIEEQLTKAIVAVSPPEGEEELEEKITEGMKGKKEKKKKEEEKQQQSFELELEGEGEEVEVEVPVQGGQTSPIGSILDDPTAMKELFSTQNLLVKKGKIGRAYDLLVQKLKEGEKDIGIVQAVKTEIDNISKQKGLKEAEKYLFETYAKNLDLTIKNKKVLSKKEFIPIDKEYYKSLKIGAKPTPPETPPPETGAKPSPPETSPPETGAESGPKPAPPPTPIPPSPQAQPPPGFKPKSKSTPSPPPKSKTPPPPPPPPPKPVDPLPPIIQPSKIKVEDIQTDLDRYREATKKLRNLIKGMNAEGTLEKLKDFEYDTVRYRLLNGKPMTAEEQQHMNEIRDVKKQIEEYEEGAKKIAKEMLEKERRSVTATKRTGLLGPHLANDTTKAVKEQLDKTPEQQIKDIDNWYIFDVPTSSTGQGTKIDNPLVAQNEMREKMLLDGSTLFTSLSNYTLQEGPFERQDFFHQHPELTKAGIGRGMFEVQTEETKEEFLQKFNDGNNGLFSQDQTREEVSDFQNIYQKPARMIGGADYKLDFTNNRGIKHTDKVWLSNLNLFFDNAPIL